MQHSKQILFTVLNWGLGHASRSIPLIQTLIDQGAMVTIGSDGRALALLREEFPALECIELPAYNIQYPTSNMFWNIGIQLPKILRAIRAEYQFIQKLVQEREINAIISDNRFGCYHTGILSVFITHQIRIKTGIPLLETVVQKINESFIKKFDECWIPDFESTPNLSGVLSHQHQLKNIQYLGALSRMQYFPTTKKYDVIVVLSGPEPQRSILEKEVIQQLQSSHLKTLIVQGKTNTYQEKQLTPNIKAVSFLTTPDLNKAILESKTVICRSGYSSIMDLVALRQKAILIPTPGQTEQIYLTEHLRQLPYFIVQQQGHLEIKKGIELLENKIMNCDWVFPKERYEEVVRVFLEGFN